MTCSGPVLRSAATVMFCLVLSGCLPTGDSQLNEEKEAHFLRGKSLATAMDYTDAIEEFEKSLEVNPHSASAHFELGWLYEEKANDFAAAIYHYQRYLAYRPNADNAEVVKQRVSNCKIELAKTFSVLGMGAAPGGQDYEKLMLENRDLKAQLAKWQAAYATVARAPIATNPVPAPPISSPVPTHAPADPTTTGDQSRPLASTSNSTRTSASGSRATSASLSNRTHVVSEHETMASIARRYGISLNALTAANPQVRPTHLRVGQTLNIPAP